MSIFRAIRKHASARVPFRGAPRGVRSQRERLVVVALLGRDLAPEPSRPFERLVSGHQLELGDDQQVVLDNGGSDAEVSDLSKSENSLDQELGRVLEVYTRVEAPGGEPLLFELYLTDRNLEARADELYRLFRPLTVGGLLLFLLLTTPLVWVVSRRADAAAADRERLLVMAADASDAERRRVARDLHDGVVQDLAGTSFALSGLARDAAGDGGPEGARWDTE